MKSFQVGLYSCHLDIPNLDKFNGNGHKIKKDAWSQDAIHGVVLTRVILREWTYNTTNSCKLRSVSPHSMESLVQVMSRSRYKDDSFYVFQGSVWIEKTALILRGVHGTKNMRFIPENISS